MVDGLMDKLRMNSNGKQFQVPRAMDWASEGMGTAVSMMTGGELFNSSEVPETRFPQE